MAKAKKFSLGGTSLVLWLALALLMLIADQFFKVLILGTYQLGEGTAFTSFFNIVRVHNTGAAFSFLAGASGWQRWFFVGLGAVAAIVIIWMLKSHAGQRLFCLAMTCILGGAVVEHARTAFSIPTPRRSVSYCAASFRR